jgi:hypothetical protein
MPNITQLPVIDTAQDQTYFLTVDSKLARRMKASSLINQIAESRVVAVPATSTSTGTPGDIAHDDRYVYICVDTNTWRRMSAGTF